MHRLHEIRAETVALMESPSSLKDCIHLNASVVHVLQECSPVLPFFSQDPVLAELLHSFKDQIVGYHEHDSLLDHKEEEALSEEERKAAWAEYEAEKKVSLFFPQNDLSGLEHI